MTTSLCLLQIMPRVVILQELVGFSRRLFSLNTTFLRFESTEPVRYNIFACYISAFNPLFYCILDLDFSTISRYYNCCINYCDIFLCLHLCG
ncbi:hypothetical protein GDO81_013092 [Engystomops pustulosus]|uniref:Uncharacterized protein n=1 Tax=Engystomops pustulosus TaxID=76066 RepID=A0AAV7B4A9_ENGPU|nr:hypothetical protein GDO81_013092 [Engystomops pustulosus]